jgi:CheY-like chemotaxis protein
MPTESVILVVEDSPSDAELAPRSGGLATRVRHVPDGEEALEYVFRTGRHVERASAEDPTVVVLDRKMPGLDGHAVLERLRTDARTRSLPIVVTSGSRDERDIERSHRPGADGHLVKAVDPGQFNAAVAETGRYRLSRNHPPPGR